MLARTLSHLRSRKVLAALCILLTAGGVLLLLLAAAAGINTVFDDGPWADHSSAIVLRLIGGFVLVAVGFAGLVAGAPDELAPLERISEETGPERVVIRVRCLSCRALNEEDDPTCRSCGSDL